MLMSITLPLKAQFSDLPFFKPYYIHWCPLNPQEIGTHTPRVYPSIPAAKCHGPPHIPPPPTITIIPYKNKSCKQGTYCKSISCPTPSKRQAEHLCRQSDLQILSVGIFKFTSDSRIEIVYDPRWGSPLKLRGHICTGRTTELTTCRGCIWSQMKVITLSTRSYPDRAADRKIEVVYDPRWVSPLKVRGHIQVGHLT